LSENKVQEILAELRDVIGGRSRLIDALLPPLIFLISYITLGFQASLAAALITALIFTVIRLRRGQSAVNALGGVIGVLLALTMVLLVDRAEGFFLPGILTGGVTSLLAVVSALVGRPLVAVTSRLARRWPWDWYRHPRVRPAYTEVTWLWALYFGLRTLFQVDLFQEAATGPLALLNLILGWPGTIALLVVSYLYGTWRLQNLGGPSVEEFQSGATPPWDGQRRGF
jgi:hypothetical protein